MNIPGENVEYVSLTDNQPLADGDIVVIEPDIDPFCDYFCDSSFQGKLSLSESSSFRLKEGILHWQREITSSLAAGKTIFVFLKESQEVFVDSGQRTYSGTGRNRQITNIVNKVDSYEFLSMPVSIINSSGKSIKLAPKANIIAPYWSEFEDETTYKVHIDGKVTQSLLLSRDGKRTVGAIIRYKESPGHLVLLPPLDLDEDDWNKKGIAFARKLTSLLVSIDKQLRSDRQATPVPSWVENTVYTLPDEEKLERELLRLQEKIHALTRKTKAIQSEIRKERSLKRLLYENGTELEDAIHEALQLLGFSTTRFRNSESEFDVVFEAKEGRFIGEAEGKDTKAINIDELRQLDMNIHEDLARDEIREPAKGVLFGNAAGLSPPAERRDFFTAKCMSAAIRSGIALVRTPDLYIVAQALKIKSTKRFATACRKAIFKASGSVVSFPVAPDTPQKEKTQHTTRESSLPTEGRPSVGS